MDKFLYKLELVDSNHQKVDLIETKKRIISILNLSDHDKNRLLVSKSALIKNSMDYHSALRDKKILERMGIKCHVVRDILNDYDLNNPITIYPVDHMAIRTIETVVCTNCAAEQPETRECKFCGFQIKKTIIPKTNQGFDQKRYRPLRSDIIQSQPVSNMSTLDEHLNQNSYRADIWNYRVPLKWLFRKSKQFNSNIVKIIIVLGLTIVLCTGLLYLCNLLWFIYQKTPVGSYYVINYTKNAHIINHFLDRNYLIFSFQISVLAFVICMVVGIMSRFLYVHRYLYRSRGVVGKLLFWGIPLSMIVGYFLQMFILQDKWSMNLIFASVPTLCLFTYCFDLVERFVPEMGDVLKKFNTLKDKVDRLMNQG